MTDRVSRERLIDLTRKALRSFGHDDGDVSTLHVPGRIEVFGKHTDYCGGRSLLMATEQGIVFSVAPRNDSIVQFHSIDHGVRTKFLFSPDLQPTIGDWSNYPMTVARRVARNFPAARSGCDIAIASDLPSAAGMSSSSAMVVGTFLMLDRINQICESELFRSCIRSREELSAYLGSIESGSGFRTLAGDRGVGTAGGSQDHTAIVCCRADTLSRYAFCPVRHEHSMSMPEDLCFVVAVSGVVAEKTGNALHRYNDVAESVRTILRTFNEQTTEQAECLADVIRSSSDAAQRLRLMFSDTPALTKRFEQFFEESEQLIPAASEAFERRDWRTFGDCADRSQALAELCLGNQIPETIRLQRAARQCGALASSAFGAGFGGSVWALVVMSEAESFVRRWCAVNPAKAVTTRPGEGARWIL